MVSATELTETAANERATWADGDGVAARLAFTLRVAEHTLKVLGPNGYRDESDSKLNVSAEKVIAESAIMLLSAARAGRSRPDLRPRLDALALQLEPFARNKAVSARICLEPTVALDHGCAHICLSAAGYPDPDLDRLLTAACEGIVDAFSRDRLPYHRLEKVWLRELIGGSAEGRPRLRDERLADTALGRRLDALSGTGDDAYALTHTVMFATDLGGRRIRLPRPLDHIVADLDAAVAVSLDRHDYDIAGELLLCWPMLRLPWSQTAILGYRVLAGVDSETGFLPTPVVDVARYRSLPVDHQSAYLLATTYHTVYVMGLLSAAVLTAGNPEGGVTSEYFGIDGSAELLQYATLHRSPQWLRYFSLSPAKEQAGLTPFLLTIALRRAVDKRDFRLVERLLDLADRFQLATTVAARQAHDILSRVALLATIRGNYYSA